MTEESFQKLMEEIDAGMALEEIPIPDRPLAAGFRVADKLGLPMPLTGLRAPLPDEDPFSIPYLFQRVQAWFSTLYGDMVNIDFNIGVIGVEISGDVFRMNFPLGCRGGRCCYFDI